ncbi:MAG: Holliday junction resolvase RuvX, partial [Chloroflexota bacterium]|nr:Holliday junction resolvase RuvX [Chloroflexota bacterium]
GNLLAERALKVVYWDERLSSWQARADLGAASRRANRAARDVDSAAARVILQDYLDAQRHPRNSPEDPE